MKLIVSNTSQLNLLKIVILPNYPFSRPFPSLFPIKWNFSLSHISLVSPQLFPPIQLKPTTPFLSLYLSSSHCACSASYIHIGEVLILEVSSTLKKKLSSFNRNLSWVSLSISQESVPYLQKVDLYIFLRCLKGAYFLRRFVSHNPHLWSSSIPLPHRGHPLIGAMLPL